MGVGVEGGGQREEEAGGNAARCWDQGGFTAA